MAKRQPTLVTKAVTTAPVPTGAPAPPRALALTTTLAAPTITIDPPFDTSGGSVQSTDPGGTMTVTGKVTTDATSMAYQIDDGDVCAIEDISTTGSPFTWSCSLTGADCPVPNAWYVLTIYAWSNTDVALKSVSFLRQAEPTDA